MGARPQGYGVLTPREIVTVAVLGTVTLSGPLAIHFFLPAIPVLKQEFAVSSAVAQAAFSVTLFVMAVSTLFYGSLSDRFGRRVVLIGGLLLFIAGSALCAASQTIAMLIVGRLLQAIGAGCGLVMSRAIAHDIFGDEGFVRIVAYLGMIYAIAPMIAPPLGGLLVDGIGWRAIFGVAAVAVALSLALALLVLPQASVAGQGGLPRPSLAAGYARLFRNPRFNGFVFQPAFGSAAFFAHASAAAFLMSELLRRPAGEFGLWFIMFPVGYWLGALATSWIGGRFAPETMVAAGAALSFAAAAGLALCVMLDLLSPLTLFLPGFFLTMGQGLALPNAQAGAMGTDRMLAGTAAGIGVFLQLAFGAASSQLTGLVANGTPYPMIAVVLGSATLGAIVGAVPWLLRRRGRTAV